MRNENGLRFRQLASEKGSPAFFVAALLGSACHRVWPKFVAHGPRFCCFADNKNQGIVPVPAKLGNGDDAEDNLYWGSAYGVKTFFARSRDWKLVASTKNPKPEVLERCIFKHRDQNIFIVADAYRGIQIKKAIVDFLEAAAGGNPEQVSSFTSTNPGTIRAGGGADLLVYVGHEGLMDFQLIRLPQSKNNLTRKVIILACISKSYFNAPLRAAGAYPLLWTTGLMAPEAYTLKSALDGWVAKEADEQIRERAAAAYHQYQKCGLNAARRLLTTG